MLRLQPDFPDRILQSGGRRRSTVFAVVALLSLVAYALLLCLNVGAVAGGSDSSGYANEARLLASGHTRIPMRTLATLPSSATPAQVYEPLGFGTAFDGHGLAPTYPPGLPLFVALFSCVAGWLHGANLVMVLHALAGTALTYGLGTTLGLSRKEAFLGAFILAVSPLYLNMSIQLMSDVPSLVWTTLAVLAALKSRQHPALALLAGAAAAVSGLLRPANVVLVLPLAAALGFSPRRWGLLFLGAAPGAVFSGIYAAAVYGRILGTGYDNSGMFGAVYIPGTLLHYLIWIPILMTPVALLSPAVLVDSGIAVRTRWVIGLWIAAFAGLYSTYKCTHETWWYLRYLLPAAPAMIVGGLLACRRLVRSLRLPRCPRARAAAAAGAFLLVSLNAVWWCHRLYALESGRGEGKYSAVAAWMNGHLPPNAVCLATQMSGAIVYYTPFTFLRCESMRSDDVPALDAALHAAGRPLYAVLFPYELKEWKVLEKTVPGAWTQVGRIDDVTVWKRDIPPR